MRKIHQLLLSELSPTRLALFAFAQVIGVAIICTTLSLYVDLSAGGGRAGSQSDYLVLTKPINLMQELVASEPGFSPREIEALEAHKGIERVGAFHSGRFAATISFSLREGGRSLYSDIFFEAVGEEYIDITPTQWGFDPTSGELPIIIPQNYLNLYNYGFAPSAGFPRLSKGVIEQLSLPITLYGALGERREVVGRIVGFSARINTILTPTEFIEWGNHTLAPHTSQGAPQRLIIQFDLAQSSAVSEFITQKGYEIESSGLDFERITRTTTLLFTATFIIGLIITLLSLGLLLLTLYLLIERSRTKMGQLAILGFSTPAITAPFRRLARWMISGSFVGALLLSLLVRSLYLPTTSELTGATTPLPYLPLLVVGLLYGVLLVSSEQLIRRQVRRAVR